MRSWILAAALAFIASASAAEGGPTLVFSGYIDYPARHDYRLEVSTYPSGCISRVATFSGEPLAKYEEMNVTLAVNGVHAVDEFQRNRRTLDFIEKGNTISLIIENENIDTRKKNRKILEIKVRPREGVLFEDGERAFSMRPDGIFGIEYKAEADSSVVVEKNRILVDGWYRSDWKREGARTIVREFTTMEIPGDWISDGGGVFTGGTLNSADLETNIVNYYLLDTYLGRHIFLPFIFGLKTGTY